MQQLWGRAGAVVSTRMQQLGGRVGSRSRHSDAIRFNQTQSDVITCHHVLQMPTEPPGMRISPVPCAQSPSRMPCATASNRRLGPSG